MITSVIKYFLGSTPDDFDPVTGNHPFQPCPDLPNCAIHSVKYPVNDQKLFEATKSVLASLSPFETDFNSQSTQINAVFRIPVFGFKDDVNIVIQSTGMDESVLHIKSSSRVGESDLGVNRRRIKKIISAINQQVKL